MRGEHLKKIGAQVQAAWPCHLGCPAYVTQPLLFDRSVPIIIWFQGNC